MAEDKPEILEDFEPLLEARQALLHGDKRRYDKIAAEIEKELAAEYCTQLPKKIHRWVDATVVQYFDDAPPVRFYIQAKMLFRDGFYEATVMLCRSTAEMICYDRLDGATHPFGSAEQVEKTNFRKLLKWLHENDEKVDKTCFDGLNRLYDIGNNYVHPKAGQDPPEDSIEALHCLGPALSIIYGLKGVEEMIGRTVRSPYCDFPDINSGMNFMLTAFATPPAVVEHANRHKNND